MKKITVTIPNHKADKWTVSAFGSSGNKRKNVWSAYNHVEKRIFSKNNLNSEGELKEKTLVSIKNGKSIDNESLVSTHPQYLMLCLTAFLEDHLSEHIFLGREKRYGQSW